MSGVFSGVLFVWLEKVLDNSSENGGKKKKKREGSAEKVRIEEKIYVFMCD